jgi:hypothetical protein
LTPSSHGAGVGAIGTTVRRFELCCCSLDLLITVPIGRLLKAQ